MHWRLQLKGAWLYQQPYCSFLRIWYLFCPSVQSLADTLTICKAFTEQMTQKDILTFIYPGKVKILNAWWQRFSQFVACFMFTQFNIIPPGNCPAQLNPPLRVEQYPNISICSSVNIQISRPNSLVFLHGRTDLIVKLAKVNIFLQTKNKTPISWVVKWVLFTVLPYIEKMPNICHFSR